MLVLEAWTAYVTGSLALLSDAGHLMVDLSGLAFAYWALRWAARPASDQATYGYYRAEVLAASLNGFLLIGVVAFVTVSAARRLSNPLEELATTQILIVAVIGLGANILAALFLHDHARTNINAQGAFLNVVGDALASLGVIIATLLVRWTGQTIYDTLVSFVVAGIIAWGAWSLLRSSLRILLELAPPHIDVDAVRNAVLAVDGVLDVHDLHVWTLTPGHHSASLHATVAPSQSDNHQILRRIEAVLSDEFELDHCTIQLEPPHATPSPMRGGPG